ncbi:MAG: beta-galactosidase [Lentisphaeraceae bacterium]|nr:beta-galactosidase [Lentisphaeraceae bacterium]
MFRICVFLSLCFSISTFSQIKLKEIHAGLDWRLPHSAKMADDAGYLSWHPDWNLSKAKTGHLIDGKIRYAVILMPTWAELEPFPGKYNWKLLDEAIEKVTSEKGCGYLFSLVSYTDSYPAWERGKTQRDGIPDWLDKTANVKYLSNGTVVTWNNPLFHKQFSRFLKAFSKKLSGDKRMIGVLMGGLDPHHGEWSWRGADDTLKEAENKHGMTPAKLEEWGKTFIDAYVDAFADMKDRLVWPCSSLNDFWMPAKLKEYREVAKNLTKYAYEKGCGGRDGGVESWNRYVDEITGHNWTNEGHLEIIDGFKPIIENRLWYTENEVWRVLDDIPKRWKHLVPGAWYASCLRTLQMRRNWMAVGPKYYDRLEAFDPAFLRWVELSLGQTGKSSKDAWCWLREGYRPGIDGPVKAIKNIERWLTQRDSSPNAISKPAKKVDLGPAESHWSIAKGHEFHARKPDTSKGSDTLNFFVDKEFLSYGKSHKITLLVSWVDSPQSSWRLVYNGSSGKVKSKAVGGTGNEIHTAVFEIEDLKLDEDEKSPDFQIVQEKGKEAVITFLRIVKAE